MHSYRSDSEDDELYLGSLRPELVVSGPIQRPIGFVVLRPRYRVKAVSREIKERGR